MLPHWADQLQICAETARQGSSSSGAAIAHVTVVAVCIVAVLGGGFAFWLWRKRQDQAAQGYLSMAAMDEDHFGEPIALHSQNSA